MNGRSKLKGRVRYRKLLAVITILSMLTGILPVFPVYAGIDHTATNVAELDAALAGVGAGETRTIKLLADINYNQGISITEGRNIIFNLNGFNLNVTNSGGEGLKVTSGSVGYSGAGAFNVTGTSCGVSANGSSASATVTNATATAEGGNGAVAINGGSIVVNGNAQGGYNGVSVANTGSMAVVNGNATGITASDSSGARASHGGSVTVNGGTAQGVMYGAYSNGSGSLITINGGDAIGTGPYSHGAHAEIDGSIRIDGDVQGTQYGVVSGIDTSVVVTGNVTVTAAANGFGVYAERGGRIEVGGNVVANGSSLGAYATYSEITIDGAILATNYIKVYDHSTEAFVYKDGSAGSRTIPTTKAGYYTYSEGTSIVWVKEELTIEPAPNYITTNFDSMFMSPGQWPQISVTAFYTGSNKEVTGDAEFVSSDTGVVLASHTDPNYPDKDGNGWTLAIASGKATITVSYGGKIKEIPVTVIDKTIEPIFNGYSPGDTPGTYIANWGYKNNNTFEVSVSDENSFFDLPPTDTRKPITTFSPGAVDDAFQTEFTDDLTWTIKQPNGVEYNATAAASICEIDGTGYTTLDNALNAVPEAGATATTIKLLQDINYIGGITVANKKITFDLNGKTLSVDSTAEIGLTVTNGSVIDITNPGAFNVTGSKTGLYAYKSTVKVTNANSGTNFGVNARDNSDITVTNDVTSASYMAASASGGSKISIGGNVSGANYGVYAQDAGTDITVTGNVSATNYSGCGAHSRGGATVTIHGNVTAAGSNSTGANLNTGGTLTVDGIITAQSYIKFGTVVKTAADITTPTTKDGYSTYTDGTSTVWVKEAAPADTTPPSVPTGLEVTDRTTSSITIAWDASTDAGGIAGNDIQMKQGSGGTYSIVGSTGGDETGFTKTGLSASTTYYFQVRAKDENANVSDWSAEISATTRSSEGGGISVPSAPLNLRLASNEDAIHLVWDPVKESNIKGYHIYRSEKGSSSTPMRLTEEPQKDVQFKDRSATTGTTYIYYAIAVNNYGWESLKSNTVEAALAVRGILAMSDVPSNAWYKDYVEKLLLKEVLDGYTDGAFRPNGKITRAEFAKMLVLAMGWEVKNPDKTSFPDVAESSSAYEYIETGVEKGVLQGYKEDGTFRPDRFISREEMAKIIAMTLSLPEAEATFKDIDTSWAKEFIKACAKAGIINGYPGDNTFKPKNHTTRAEAAAMIARMLKD
ncbi:MAG: S-layer homology domain-containing protein [Actinobacteria bacterium]|nr:S-layer homology domain-containing protein [Actinomycetota bacterium]